MKKNIHPETREVLFHDTSVDQYFLIRSTLKTTQTKEWEEVDSSQEKIIIPLKKPIK